MEAYREATWSLPTDFLSFEHFERVVSRLESRSSPGWPLMREAPTIGEWLGRDALGRCDSVQMARLWKLVQTRLDGESPNDDIRLFIKREPHKLSKILEGRYRIIFSVALVDQVVWHMLFDSQNDREIEVHSRIPSKAGWTPSRGGWRRLISAYPGPYTSIDKSQWDWGCPMWVLWSDLRIRAQLCRDHQSPLFDRWLRIAKAQYAQVFEKPVLRLSDGRRFMQKQGGLMKSGLVNTIATNSRAQWLLHAMAWVRSGGDVNAIPELGSMGDDTFQLGEASERYVSELQHLGCEVKEVDSGDVMVFAGHAITAEACVPSYAKKHWFALMHANPTVLPEMLDSYIRNYACSPEIGNHLRALHRRVVGTDGLHPQEVSCWYHGYDISWDLLGIPTA